MRYRTLLLLAMVLCCICFAGAACADGLPWASVRTGSIREGLPPVTVTVTDTGRRTEDQLWDKELLVQVAAEDGRLLQEFTYFSQALPQHESVVPFARFEDLNFDGCNDLVLLTAQGARDVFSTLALWDEQAGRFRPVEQQPVWDGEEKKLTFQAYQLQLCNYETVPGEKRIYSVADDGHRYRTEVVYEWESPYGLVIRSVADVYDAGREQIGETLMVYGSQAVRCWDAVYPEVWYYGNDDTAFERQTALRLLSRGNGLAEPALLRVANVDWVNLRSMDSKQSPSLAKLNAGETVHGLVFGCGEDGGWTLVWLPPEDLESPGITGYIWHSFLEPDDAIQ